MTILGVNGWTERSHDAAACLVVDGKIAAFIEEERPTRFKHAFDVIPHRAIQQCLEIAGLSAADIDIVATGWRYLQKYEERGLASPKNEDELIDLYLPQALFGPRNASVSLVQYEHHLAHAASIYRAQPDKDAVVIVLDGQGEHASTTMWHGQDGELKKIMELGVAESLGYFFEAHNRILGFNYLESGKTMGLASYGKPYPVELYTKTPQGLKVPFSDDLALSIDATDEQLAVIEHWKPVLQAAYKLHDDELETWALKSKKFSAKEKNIAATAQAVVEDAILHLATLAKKKTGAQTLCVAGGVGLNCNANMAIWNSGLFKDVQITPLASDLGVALGAALQAAADYDNQSSVEFTAYLGPSYSDKTIEACARELMLDARYVEDPSLSAAQLVADGKVIGWFNGRMEAGPRALGNRSILAHPGIKGMNDTVNNVKSRELWRPLAPACLKRKWERCLKNRLDHRICFSRIWCVLNGARKYLLLCMLMVVHVRKQSLRRLICRTGGYLINSIHLRAYP